MFIWARRTPNKRRSAIIASMIVSAALFSACGKSEIPPVGTAPDARPASAMRETETYSLYYELNEVPLGLYEPEQGCYAGAYVLSNRQIAYDMKKFDERAEKKHAVSLYNLKAGAAFPDAWLLSCIADMKTPLIVIKPPNAYLPYDYEVIEALASSFSAFTYNTPVFVEFYPNTGQFTQDAREYTDFYRYARAVFREKVPNAAFVWGVDAQEALDSGRFYPGDSWVDWVSLHIYDRLRDGAYEFDPLNTLDYFYYTYQKTKPIMISQLAVSHYTSQDHAYRNEAAAREIARLYQKIAQDYPRVKLVNYMDINEVASGAGDVPADNFLLTENSSLLDAYRQAVSDGHFLSVLDGGGEYALQLMKSPFPVLKKDGTWFVSASSFQYDLNTQGLTGEIILNGEKYYDLNRYLKNGRRSLISAEENHKIILALNAA